MTIGYHIKSASQGLNQGLSPQKRLGQNFLWQKSVLNKIVAAADLSDQDLVLEVGPGLGSLTQALAKKANRVIAIEKDSRLIPLLKEKFSKTNNVEIVRGDIRELVYRIWYLASGMTTPKKHNTKYKIQPFDKLRVVPSGVEGQDTRYKVVANLPYYVATHIIRKFLEAKKPPELMVLMLQKEVARRICSRPGQMSLLAASVQFYADVKIIGYVSRKSFWPKPKVDSAIIKIVPKTLQKTHDRGFSVMFKKRFFKIVKAGFSQPRKQLANNLAKGLKLPRNKIEAWLKKNNIKPEQRAQELNLENWLALTKRFVL